MVFSRFQCQLTSQPAHYSFVTEEATTCIEKANIVAFLFILGSLTCWWLVQFFSFSTRHFKLGSVVLWSHPCVCRHINRKSLVNAMTRKQKPCTYMYILRYILVKLYTVIQSIHVTIFTRNYRNRNTPENDISWTQTAVHNGTETLVMFLAGSSH